MKIRKLLFTCLCLTVVTAITAREYVNGVFVLNEDWYGHNNSTLNFLHTNTGEFDYYIIQNNNLEKSLTLGCTAQFGTIYGDNIYIISKQDQDGGESADKQGGRVVVADARTMEIKKSIRDIAERDGKSIADGRSFVGVNETKGYIGTSNGIYLFNLENLEIKECIEGTENPLITGDEIPGSGLGPLYNNQIGIMIRSLDYVFAIQQDKGILVIDPETDTITHIIEGCFSTMTQSKDGYIWAGKNSNMAYQKYPYGDFGSTGEQWEGNQLLKVNPSTLDTEIIEMPMGGINQTWYAWTAGSLCASTKENALYFTFNTDKWSWFTTSAMYKYNIDNEEFTQIYDSSNEGRYFYGAAVRIHPFTDELYASLYKSNISQEYWIYKLDNNGNRQQEYQPILRYWFPSLFIFPDVHEPVAEDFSPVNLTDGTPFSIDLSSKATDSDNFDTGITKRIVSVSNQHLLKASIKNNILTLTALDEADGNAEIIIRFNSNGKIVDKTLAVTVSNTNSIHETTPAKVNINTKDGILQIEGIEKKAFIEVYTLQGQLLISETAESNHSIYGLSRGQTYIVRIDNNRYKINF